MNNQQAVVDQIVQNLAFEVEAVPKTKSIQATSISQNTPLNVKIKVRKKDEIQKPHDVSSITDDTTRAVQKIRLVNSDRTIMTFDVFMEAEFEKKPPRKLRKHIFDMLRPGLCLRAMDDDEYPYMPSSSYTANITEPSVATKSDGTLKQTFTLSKNADQDYTVLAEPASQKWLLGKCKPGGCLDPPFSEDKYSYKPSTRSGPERGGEELLEEEDVGSGVYSNKKPITLHDDEDQSNERHSTIFDSGLFKNKKKRRSSDKSTNTNLPDKTESIVDIYQGESAANSISTHSNSIITYPPKIRSDPRISDDKTVKSRGPSEDKSRKSFNDHSEPYFIRPKGVKRVKEKDTLDLNNYPNHQSSDATALRNSLKETFKMPAPLPIPIPIPIMPNKQKPKVSTTNDDILKTQGDNADITELDSMPDTKSQDQELQDTKNLKDTNITRQLLRDISVTGETEDKPVVSKSSKVATSIPSNVEQPSTPSEIEDQDLDKTKLQLLQHTDSKNNIENTAQPNKKSKTEPLKIPVPVPVPFHFSDPNRAAVVDSKTISKQSNTKLTQSNKSFETKIIPPTITDTPFEDSRDMQQNIDPRNRSGENELTANANPNSQYSDKEADAIPENFLRTRGEFSNPESDIENPVSIALTIKEEIKQDTKKDEITEGIEKPASQNDIIEKDTTATKYIEESSDVNEIADPDTPQIKGSPNKDERKDSERISLSKLSVLLISTSLLNGSKTSAASVKNETKRSDSPDKHLYDVGLRGTNLGVHKDENRTSLPSRPEYKTDTVIGKTSELHDDNKYVCETTKPNNDDIIDFYTESETKFTNQENINVTAPPVIMDNTEPTPNFRPHKEVNSETDFFGKPIKSGREFDPSVVPFTTQIASRSKSFDEDDDIHSTVSRDKVIPSTPPKKYTDRIPSSDKRVILPADTALSSIQSTSTLKSAMKKDTTSVNLGFHSYLNDKNERTLQTFDAANPPKRLPNDSVTVLKTQIRISSNEIRIPVDSEHDMSIRIKKTNANQRVSISESGFVNVIDNSRVKKQISPVQSTTDAEMISSGVKAEGRKDDILKSDGSDDHFIDYYEQELVPLQLIIKNLRDEIDLLAAQQCIFKDKLFSQNKSKLPRLVHSNKRCFGCVRK